MDTYSSGEELVIKTRKPYTITKQRERWTEEEHNRFLEALKLYGRTWQRIEDHIGTKTAVQIRSHAQKFFAKLEKEALVKGVPVGQALDIEIPPPRPKRKPSNSYPRKISVGGPSPHVGAKDGKKLASSPSRPTKHLLDLEKEPLPEKPGSDEKLEDAKENQVEVNFEVFKLFQGARNTSPCPKNKKYLPTVGPSKNSCTFRDCAPILNEVINAEETNESHATVNHEGNQKLDKINCRQSFQDAGICIISNTGNSQSSHEKLIQEEKREKSNEPKNFGLLSTNGMQANQNYPRHVPVHILDGNEGMDKQNTSPDFSCQESIFQKTGGIHGQPNQFANPVLSTTTEHNGSAARSSIHQSFPIFHPLSPQTHSNQNDYRSFFHTSTFSSLLVSALLQNPAAHAAASFAATFWPLANVETSVDSRAGSLGSFSSRQISSAPSMAALAAATVASATAWWTAHGLLPLCAPFHTGLTSCTQSAAVTPMDNNKTRAASNGRREPPPDPVLKDRQLEAEYSEALQEQHSASKAPILSDSEATEGAKLNTGLPANNNEQAAAVTEHNDLNTTKTKKLLDRSSCGSNTPSSSEVETDALDKLKKGKEESKEPDIIPSGDTSYRRGRSSINSSDSWKEVSEGGRLAFQALFSREVLPQSFSPHDMKNKTHQKNNMEMTKQSDDLKAENASQLDLNSKTWGTSSQGTENNPIMRDENIGYGSILTMGPGHVKLKAYRTGFKPYKRCSVEAKESRMVSANSQDEEKGAKRIRLEG